MTQPTKRVSAKEVVIQYIEDYINSNSLKPGMSLPSEENLAKELNISRNIIREGFQYFKTLGIIGTKPKTGAYIKKLFPDNPFKEYLSFINNNKQRIKEIGQMRMIIELGIIPILIEKSTPEDLKNLEEITQKMFETKDKKKSFELEFAFHGLLLDIVDNEIVTGLKPLLVEFLEKYHDISGFVTKEINQLVAKEHLNIVDALRIKDEKKLISLIKNHYKFYATLN